MRDRGNCATRCTKSHRPRCLLPMALEHAILVSLSEQPGTGRALTRRFERSIGFFWSATHQQIYRVLGRMEAEGWVSARATSDARSREYAVTAAGRDELQR